MDHGVLSSLSINISQSPTLWQSLSSSLKFRPRRRDTVAPTEEVPPSRDRSLDDVITHDSDGALCYKELEVRRNWRTQVLSGVRPTVT